MTIMTKGERIETAINRAEEAAVDLIREAENWSLQNRSLWDTRVHRKALMEAARNYARAINAVARVRRPSSRREST